MYLTPVQFLIMIAAIALGCMLTRFTPFLLFPEGKALPDVLVWLGEKLPAAMMGLLVVFSLKHVDILTTPHGLPELVGVAVVAVLHLWKRNMLVSIGIGTLVYMLMV